MNDVVADMAQQERNNYKCYALAFNKILIQIKTSYYPHKYTMCYFIFFFLENLFALSLDRIDINEII